ncbi:hypothetical protein MELA_01965 [Candidatus Methylomirabilis lanthanidiphila]|uniref:Uncharacterized protein n=1 Tax=Candidatus Methylomirabilis lanthanidiphila TaxID=2211376 RepID=A0A564ZJQ6_9BACT|nr:hypothetical protein MELA_01965 [Candidatus Methylomirabilis lanthanidiphila]
MIRAGDLGFLSDERCERVSDLLLEVQKMLGSMFRRFNSELQEHQP